MKILQIIQRNQLRGAEIFACQLSEELNKAGQETEVLVLFGEDMGLLNFDLKFQYLKADEKKGWLDGQGYRKLAAIINRGKYDIVQANAGDTLRYAALSKMLFGWKGKLVFRNANKISDFLKNPVKRAVYGRLLRQAAGVASVSEECCNDIIGLFPFIKDKTFALPIGIYLPKEEKINKNPELKSGKPVLLHAGSFVPEKNHAGLIRIFSKVINKYPEAQLWLAGEGKGKEAIQKMVADLALTESVEFLGARKDLGDLMQQADIFLLPSLIEGLPAVILESFAARLPVVAYDTGGIAEVITDGITGRLIPKNHEQAFVDAVCGLISIENNSIKEYAYRQVAEKYTNQKAASAFLKAYQKIVHH